LFAAACQTSFEGPNGQVRPSVPLGPDGEAVIDRFYFMHQPLTGNGSITAHVTSLTGIITYPPPNHDQIVPDVVPWAKAGVILKESTKQGSPYAAVMLTGSHGVRMQCNFIEDRAGGRTTVIIRETDSKLVGALTGVYAEAAPGPAHLLAAGLGRRRH